ncbi:hypothetical protein RUND412_003803 [Rhizina undulata]
MLSIPRLTGAEIHSDTPVSSLLDSANALLAAGDMSAALDHFDAAVKRDPSNYLTLFKRGATYLSLGKSTQASADFDAVLSLKPDFEAALIQRAKLKAKVGDWDSAVADYRTAGGKLEEIEEVREAEKALADAEEAEKKGDWESCVSEVGKTISTASGMASARALRARCKLAKGEIFEGINDLTGVATLNPSSLNTHIQIASLLYYTLADYDRSVAQLRKCLHSDPDSKPCSKSFRRIKNLEKTRQKAKDLLSKKQYALTAKLLVDRADEEGLITEVTSDISSLETGKILIPTAPSELLADINEIACEAYSEKPLKAKPFCEAALKINPDSLTGILWKASSLISEDLFEEAIRLLDNAKNAHPNDQKLNSKLQEAHTLLKRSKSKDYYKVLSVARDASERDIKKAYRIMTKKFHPDKYRGDLSKEEVEKKMASINEAYEVLSNPELRERFDRGDDPNEQGGHGGSPFHGHPFGGQQFVFRQGGGSPFGNGGPFGGQGGFKFNF